MGDTPWQTSVAVATVTAVLSVAGNQWIERYKARTAVQKAEQDARRSYEYDARKKLYTDAEPVLFQLDEHAGNAVERISHLADLARRGRLGAGGWLTDKFTYYRPSTFYMLLAPGAAMWLLRERVTFLDLSLDPVLDFQHKLGFAGYEAWSADFPLARQRPRLAYTPSDDQKWQGLFPGERERPLRALIAGEGAEARVKTYAEFEDEYKRKRSHLNREIAAFAGLFDGFTPATHPVLWRVLVAQYFVYRALRRGRDLQAGAGQDGKRVIDAGAIVAELAQERAAELMSGADPDGTRLDEAAVSSGKLYLTHVLTHAGSFYTCALCAASEEHGASQAESSQTASGAPPLSPQARPRNPRRKPSASRRYRAR